MISLFRDTAQKYILGIEEATASESEKIVPVAPRFKTLTAPFDVEIE